MVIKPVQKILNVLTIDVNVRQVILVMATKNVMVSVLVDTGNEYKKCDGKFSYRFQNML